MLIKQDDFIAFWTLLFCRYYASSDQIHKIVTGIVINICFFVIFH